MILICLKFSELALANLLYASNLKVILYNSVFGKLFKSRGIISALDNIVLIVSRKLFSNLLVRFLRRLLQHDELLRNDSHLL